MRKKFSVLRAVAFIFSAIFLVVAKGHAQEGAPAEYTEVVLVATQHFISDMPDGYTPGHLRALLSKVSADVLAVEAPSNVANPWEYAPLDLWQITKPWADLQKKEIIPVGWNEPQYQAQLGAMFQAFTSTGRLAEYQKTEQDFQAASAQQSNTCEDMNSDHAQQLWRTYHAGLHALYGKDTPWEDWNKNILSNIVTLCGRFKGKRVAVVFGGAHCYYIQDQLAKQQGIKLLPAGSFFPLSAEEVQNNTSAEDYLRALRVLNFNVGMVPSTLLKRLEGFLGKIKDSPRLQNDYFLFHGKYLLHAGQPEQALPDFQKVAALDENAVSLFDHQSRLKEIGLVYAAIAKMQMKKYSEAREDLHAILTTANTTQGTKLWAVQLLNSLPQ